MTTDLMRTIAPKSDQLNFDDLIGGRTLTIKITKVSMVTGDQPIAISFEGDNGKPYKPSKGMRRVLVQLWGGDGAAYVGRSLTLYGDPTVMFGKDIVGGIRISHMSDISHDVTLSLTSSKAKRKPFTVKVLNVAAAQKTQAAPPAPVTQRDETVIPATEQNQTDNPFAVQLAQKKVYAEDAASWVLLFNSFVIKCATGEQLNGFVKNNETILNDLHAQGYMDFVDEVKADIETNRTALSHF